MVAASKRVEGGRLWRSFSTLRGYPGDAGQWIISACEVGALSAQPLTPD